MRAWVTLGDFAAADGRLVALDAADGSAREVLRFTPPPPLRVEGKGFTGACRLPDGDLLVCGAAAVFRFDAALSPRGVLAAPDFDDLHGVHHADDRLYVVNTGLDAIDVFDRDGMFMGRHAMEMAWLTARRLAGRYPSRAAHAALHRRGWAAPERPAPTDFAPDRLDGRYYRDGGPHRRRDYAHPNHAHLHGGRLYVTSLARRAVIDAFTWRAVAAVDAPPHDARVHDGALWLTRVDGRVERRPLAALDAPEAIDAAAAADLYGWCRGLHLDGDRLWVGFTAIHHPPRYAWDRVDPARTTTGVACLDRRTGEPVARFDLSRFGTHPKVFALLEPA